MIRGRSNVPTEFLQDHGAGGLLSSLTPIASDEAQAVVARWKGISPKYIDFVATIGVGETRNGLSIYAPFSATEMTGHASSKIYNSKASRRLFGLLPEKRPKLEQFVCVADVGASWRYCLNLNGGDEVFSIDMFGFEVRIESDNFFFFVQEQVFDLGSN